jgi:putative FmdB family regulatory protein
MPIYEYSCRKCGKAFEVLVRGRSDPAPRCPACGSPKPAKMLSAFAVTSADPTSRCETCPGAKNSRSASSPCAGGVCPASRWKE